MSPENDLRVEIDKLEQRFAENSKGRVFAHLADAYRKAGEFAKAEGLILHGLKNHPNYISAYIVLGRVYLDSERHSDALGQFTKVLELDPQNMIALRALGDLAVHEGEENQARSWYERMLQIDPRSGEAQEGLKSLEKDDEAESLEGFPESVEESSESVAIEEDESPDEPTYAAEDQAEAGDAEPPASSSGMPWELVDAPTEAVAETPEDEGEPAALESLDSVMSSSRDGTESSPAEGDEPTPSAGTDIDLDLHDMESWTPGLLRHEDVFEADSVDEDPPSVESSLEAVGEIPADKEEEPELEPELEVKASDEDGGMVTETMAELYAEQGLLDDALRVYRQLAEARPHDDSLLERIAELENGFEVESSGLEEPPALIWGADPESSESQSSDDLEPQTPAELAEPAVGGDFEFASQAPTDGLDEIDPFAGSFDASVMGDMVADPERTEAQMDREAGAEPDLESESAHPASDLEALAAQLEGASPYMEGREPSGPVFDFDLGEPASSIADEAEATADTDLVEDEIAAAENDEFAFDAVDAAAATFDSVLAEFSDPVADVAPDEEEAVEPPSDFETPTAEPAAPSFEFGAPSYEVPTPEFETEDVDSEAEPIDLEPEPIDSEPEPVALDAEADEEDVATSLGVDAFLAGATEERSEYEVNEPTSAEKEMASAADALVSDEEMWAAPLPVGDPSSEEEVSASEAEVELGPDTIETYLSGLLAFSPDFSPGGVGVAGDDEVASTVAGGETSEDLARFQEWLRGLKR